MTTTADISALEQARQAAMAAGDTEAVAAADELIAQARAQGADQVALPGGNAEAVGETVGDIVLPAIGAGLGGLAGAAHPALGLVGAGTGLFGGHMLALGGDAGSAGVNTALDLVGGRVLEPVAGPVVERVMQPVLRGIGRAVRGTSRGVANVLGRAYRDAGRVVPRDLEAELGAQAVEAVQRDMRAPTIGERRAMAATFERETGAQMQAGPLGVWVEALFRNQPTTQRIVENIHSQREIDLEELGRRLFGGADAEEAGDWLSRWLDDTGDTLLRREQDVWDQIAEHVPDTPDVRARIAEGLRQAVERVDPSGRLDVVTPLTGSREAIAAKRAMHDLAQQIEAGELPTSAPVYLDQLRRDVQQRARDILERNPGSERARRLQALARELEGVQADILPDPALAERWRRVSQDYAVVKGALDDLRRYLPNKASGETPEAARKLVADLGKRRDLWRAASRLMQEAGDDEPARMLSSTLIASLVDDSRSAAQLVKRIRKLSPDVQQALDPDQVRLALLYSSFREIAGEPARKAVTPGFGHGRLQLGPLSTALLNAGGAMGAALIKQAEQDALRHAVQTGGRLPTLSDVGRQILRTFATDVLRYGGAEAARQGIAALILPQSAQAAEPQQQYALPTAEPTQPPTSVLDLLPRKTPMPVPPITSQQRQDRTGYAQPVESTTQPPAIDILQLVRR